MNIKNNMNKILNGDCLELMQDIPDKSIDMVLCDLPYGTTACKWDVIIPFDKLWKQYERIIKDNSAIVLTASQPFTTKIISSNMKMFKYELIWGKSNGGGFLNANRQPLKRHENILIFSKKQSIYNPQKTLGKKYTCTRASAGETTKDQSVAGWVTNNDGSRFPISILNYSNQTGLHPTQKPTTLFEYLIKTYTNEGAVILDNCSGSGTTAIACINTNRNYICIEKDITYFDLSIKRVENHTKQMDLLCLA